MSVLVRSGLGLLLSCCGGERGGPLGPPLAGSDHAISVEVTPDSLRLNLGETGDGRCRPKNAAGEVLGRSCDWASDDPDIVTATTRTQSSRFAASRPGSTWIVARVGGVSDSTRVTVLEAARAAAACQQSGYLRQVFVSSAEQLTSALATARPGDQIRLADGVYRGRFVAQTQGTAEHPISLCGSRDAILEDNRRGYTLHLLRAEWWVMHGFTVTNGLMGVMLDWSNDNLLDSLAIHHIVGECVHFRRHSSRNSIQRSHIHHCGEGDRYGEGVYIGSAPGNWSEYTEGQPDTAQDNRVEGNFIHDTSAEAVESKEGTRRTVVIGNSVERTGPQRCALYGGNCGSDGADAAIATRGGDGRFECNDIRAPVGLRGFSIYSGGSAGDGDDNSFRWNLITMLSGGPPIGIASGQTGNTQSQNTPEGYTANCSRSAGPALK